MSITLTGAEIMDLARCAGFEVQDETDESMLETEYTIGPCPAEGVRDEDGGPAVRTRLIAYLSEYPDEGVFPLGAAEATPTPATGSIT